VKGTVGGRGAAPHDASAPRPVCGITAAGPGRSVSNRYRRSLVRATGSY